MKGIWYDTRFTTSTAKEEDKAEYIGGEVKGGEVKPGFFMHKKEGTKVKPKGILKTIKAQVVGHQIPSISDEGFTSVEYEVTRYYRRIIYLPYMPELALGIWVDVEISLPPEPDSQEYEPLLTRGPY